MPRPDHWQEATSHIRKCSSVREHSENIIHHLRKREAFFQDMFGVEWNRVTKQGGVNRGARMHDTWHGSHMGRGGVMCEITWLVMVVTRCWRPVCVPWFWHLTTAILPGTGCSGPRLPFGMALCFPRPPAPPPEPPKWGFRCKLSAWGPNCKIRMFLRLKKNKQGKQSHIT